MEEDPRTLPYTLWVLIRQAVRAPLLSPLAVAVDVEGDTLTILASQRCTERERE
jgi:hypothetical protein